MPDVASSPLDLSRAPPDVRVLSVADLKDALAKGVADFRANPTHVIFLVLVYPFAGLLIARLTADANLMPLFYPMAAGFALLGPLAALGLYEMSRQRELGREPHWSDALGVLKSPAIWSIAAMGGVLAGIFVAWLFAARWLAGAMIGDTLDDPAAMSSYMGFVSQILSSPAGWGLVLAGNFLGLLFAVAAFSISVVSFPLMLDRHTGYAVAMATSLRAVAKNPVVLGLWGLFIALALALGTLPFFIGLALVIPVLGHASWHLYRKVVV